MSWVIGEEVNLEVCQHCIHTRVWWIENEAGKPPTFAYSNFPKDGQVLLSKKKIVVICRCCSLPPQDILLASSNTEAR